MLNNVIAADISGTDYTTKHNKIRAGVVASVIATLIFVVIIIMALAIKDQLAIAQETTPSKLHVLPDNISAGLV